MMTQEEELRLYYLKLFYYYVIVRSIENKNEGDAIRKLDLWHEYVNISTKKKGTLLTLAVCANMKSLVSALLSYGWNSTETDSKDNNAFYYAFGLEHYPIGYILIKDKSNVEHLHYALMLTKAVKYVPLRIVGDLSMDAKVDFNWTDPYGNNTLHIMAKYNHIDKDIMHMILNKKCDMEHKNFMDETPLTMAVKYGSVETVKWFLAFGANINTMTKGCSLIQVAFRRKNYEMTSFLFSQFIERNGVSFMDDEFAEKGKLSYKYFNKRYSYNLLKARIKQMCMVIIKEIIQESIDPIAISYKSSLGDSKTLDIIFEYVC